MTRIRTYAALLSTGSALFGCADAPHAVERIGEPLVYGEDGRTEYYALTDAERERVAKSSVALIPNRFIERDGSSIAGDAPLWGELEGLCADEPFIEQPALAFCSGVLVDYDLVLTAGHCVRVYSLSDFSVVFGYYYTEPGVLAVGRGDIAKPVEIVSEALDPEGTPDRLDYAWLRLARPIGEPREPAPIFVSPPALEAGELVTTIGSPSGVPLKLDAGGVVEDARELGDYFVASTDTSRGWSGGGAFDETLSLVGVLARGGLDLEASEDGCLVSAQRSDDEPAEEDFTYAHRALERLCDELPEQSICRPDCGDPCRGIPPPPKKHAADASGDGCSVARPRGRSGAFAATLLFLAFEFSRRRRGRSRSRFAPSGSS